MKDGVLYVRNDLVALHAKRVGVLPEKQPLKCVQFVQRNAPSFVLFKSRESIGKHL